MVPLLTLLVKYYLIHLLIFTPTCKIFVTMSRVLVLTPALKSALLLVLTPTCKSGLNMELIRLLTQKKSWVFYKYLRIFFKMYLKIYLLATTRKNIQFTIRLLTHTCKNAFYKFQLLVLTL